MQRGKNATVDRRRRRFSAEVEQHEVVAVDSSLEQANVLRWNIRRTCRPAVPTFDVDSTPIVAVAHRELDAVAGTDGRQHDLGVTL